MFQRITNRLSFFFPRNAFVYLDSRLRMHELHHADFHKELGAALKAKDMQLAFPPNLRVNPDVAADAVTYWEYHFPGLRSLHPRKQRLLFHQIVLGFDLGMAAMLMARKLGLDPEQNHLLFFDQQGRTWHHGNLRDLEAAITLMKHISQGLVPMPWLDEAAEDVSFQVQEPDGVFRQVLHSMPPPDLVQAAVDDSDEFVYNDRLLETLEGGMRRFVQEQEQIEQQELRSDPDVLRTLEAIRNTETELGFFKIMARMLTKGGLTRGQQEDVNSTLAHYAAPEFGPYWNIELQQYTLSVHFPDLWITVKLQPLQYATYQLFLSHPEGIRLKERQRYKDELYAHYRAVKGTDQPGLLRDQVDKLMDPRNDDAMNQCLSNIKKRFLAKMGEEVVAPYIIRREHRNAPHRIACAEVYRR